MVQLIRIVSSNETECNVTNFFNEAITVPSNGKIALESLKIQLSDIITVTSDNNTFEIQVSKLQPNFNVTLRNGIYSQDDFITELTRAMAASMSYDFTPRTANTELNYTEWKPIIFNDKLVIQYSTAMPETGRLNNWKGLSGAVTVTLQDLEDGFYIQDYYERNSVTTDPVTFVSMSTEKVALKGPLEWRVTINKGNLKYLETQAADPNNIVIGLRNIAKPIKPLNTYTIDDLDYCIQVLKPDPEDDTYTINVYENGVLLDTEDTVITEDDGDLTVLIRTSDNNLFYDYTTDDPNAATRQFTNIGQSTFSYDINYKGFVLFGSQYNSIYNIVYGSSPYQNANSSGLSLVTRNSEIQDIETHIKYDELGQPASGPTPHTLIFSDTVKKLLGFLLNQYTVTSIANQFLAESAIDQGYYSDEIIVELPTEFIKAYEGSQNRRRNIIRYIPSDPLQLTKVRSHTFQYPLYLELQNKSEKVLNQFQVRLLDKFFNPIKISSEPGSMTVLLIVE